LFGLTGPPTPKGGEGPASHFCVYLRVSLLRERGMKINYSLRFSIFSVFIMKDETEGLLFPNISSKNVVN